MALREVVPREFSDDERWYRYFSKTLIIAMLCVGMAGVFLCKLLNMVGLLALGICLTLICEIATILLISVPLPKGHTMDGSGHLLYRVLTRFVIHKRRRCFYIKGAKREEE